MIKRDYKILFSLEVFHTYFENSICNCLQFKPDQLTLNLITQFGFNVREKVNGFDFYFNPKNSIDSTFDYISGTTGLNYFCFNIITTNQAFNTFTDLPIDWLGQLVFDSHSNANTYENGNVLLEKELISVNPENAGSLKIYFADILKYQNNGTAAFQINFAARSTQWNYYIINKSELQLNNPVVTGKKGVDFEGPENVTIQTGQKALLFSSGNNLIPLSKVPTYIFDLVNNLNEGNRQGVSKNQVRKTIFKGLPNPAPEKLEYVQINSADRIISPMYVYI